MMKKFGNCWKIKNKSSVNMDDYEIEEDPMKIVPDLEILELNLRKREKLKTSWSILYSRIGATLCYVGTPPKVNQDNDMVVEPFMKLFEEYPSSKEFFLQFKDKSIENLREDVKLMNVLQEHAIRVLQMVEKTIYRLDDLNKITPYLLSLGRFHRHVGVPKDYFGVMGIIFVHSAKPYFEEASIWNEELEEVWFELFSYITRAMTHGYKYLSTT